GPVSMKTHCHPSLTRSPMASVVASTSNSFGFFTLPRRVHQLARLSWGSRSSSATRRLSSAARTASALESVVLPTPPLVLASVMTRNLAGCWEPCGTLVREEGQTSWMRDLSRLRGTKSLVVPPEWYLT